MQSNRLGFTEFQEVLFDLTSSYVLPNQFRSDNEAFIDSLVNDLYNDYYYSVVDNSVRHYSKLIEVFFYNYFKFN